METLWIGGAVLLFLLVIALIWRGNSTEGFQAAATLPIPVNKAITCPQLRTALKGVTDSVGFLQKSSTASGANLVNFKDIIDQQLEMKKLYELLINQYIVCPS